MLTSKEVLERTGISRATLNNYIGCGIVARPEILQPQPQDGGAPRIGYFPDDVVARIEEIQRLKREGWSMTRITERFAGAPKPAADAGPAHPAQAAVTRTGTNPGRMPGLTIGEIAHPAYMVNDRFEVLWLNDAAGQATSVNPAPLPVDAVTRGIFRYLLEASPANAEARRAILGFHLGLAKQRGTSLPELCRDLTQDDSSTLERLYQQAERIDSGLVAQARISIGRGAGALAVSLNAVHFREGILFLYAPAGAAPRDVATLLAHPERVIGDGARRRMPELTHVAVLVADLQHSTRLWAELPPEEYFELINQIWLTLEPVFRRHHGTHGKHPGEGLVCYFFPRAGSNHVWDALSAACQMREAMRRLGKEWQLRKGWAAELYMNTAIDEGQEWVGTLRSGPEIEFTVLGDAVDRATHLSNVCRNGAILATRDAVGKLGADEKQRLTYGVRRSGRDGREAFVPRVFSRVENLADAAAVAGDRLAAIGRLPVTEIVDIAGSGAVADPATYNNPP